MLLFMIHHHICSGLGILDRQIHEIPYRFFFFYMPYFFYKAGCFYKPDISWAKLVSKSAKRLLVPAIIFTAIGYTLFGATEPITSAKFWWWPIRQLFAMGAVEGNIAMWFLLSLFWVRILFRITENKMWLQIAMVIVALFIAACCSYYDIRPRYVGNISLGIIFYALGYWLQDKNNAIWLVICLLCYCAIVVFPSRVDFVFCRIVDGYFILYVLGSIAACYLFVILGKYLDFCTILPWIGRNSMVYLCTHLPIIYAVNAFCCKQGYNSYTSLLLEWLAVLIMCTLLVFTMNSRYCAWMIGETKKEKL